MRLKTYCNRHKQHAPLVAIVIATIILLSPTLTKPFIGHHDWNGVQYGNMARNYVRYGLATKLGQVENSGIVSDKNFSFNTHHPATLPLLISVSYLLFGVSEWSTRLVPIIASVFTVIFTYLICEKLVGKRSGYIAAALLIVTPMFRYYASMPVHEPLIMAAIIWSVYEYYRWQFEAGKWIRLYGAVCVSLLLGWAGYYLIPLLYIHARVYRQKTALNYFIPFVLSALGAFSLHLVHNAVLTGNAFGGGLLDILRFRLNIISPTQETFYGFTIKQFIIQELNWIRAFFTNIQTLGAISFVVLAVKRQLNSKSSLIVILLLYGVSHTLVFRNAAFIHDYMLYYLGPGMAIATAYIVYHLIRFTSQRYKLPSFIGVAFAIILIAVTFFERHAFYNALASSNMHLIGKQVGEDIAKFTQMSDTVRIHSPIFALHYSKFSYFYADRNIIFYNQEHDEPPPADYEVIIKNYESQPFDSQEFVATDTIYIKPVDNMPD